MQPNIVVNMRAVLASMVASFAFGSIWYGPLLGTVWAKAQGFGDRKVTAKDMIKPLGFNLLGTFLMAFVLAHDVLVWRPSTWHAGTDQAPYVYGFFGGFFVWIGYVVPMLLNSVAFEGKSWKVFVINASFQFLSFQIMGMILSYWR